MNRKLFFVKCPVCMNSSSKMNSLCDDCREEISKYSYGNRCIKCGKIITTDTVGMCSYCKRVKPKFDLAIAVFPYKNNFKEAVRAVKFYEEYYRIKGMARLVYEEFMKMNLKVDCVVYVPSEFNSYLNKKYCFSQELAYGIAKELNVSVYKGFLIKKYGTEKQSLVEFEKRYTNVKGRFFKSPLTFRNVKDKRVLLVDDIITTGSTMSECAEVLKQNGAKSVYGVAMAYGASNV